MSDPVLDSLLIHRCSIQQPTPGSTDDWGEPGETWNTIATNVPCLLQPVRSQSLFDAEIRGNLNAVINKYLLYLKYTQTINNTMRITNITDKSGTLLDETKNTSGNPLTFEIETITDPAGQKHHKVAYIRRVTGVGQ